MSALDDGGPAFPQQLSDCQRERGSTADFGCGGMSLRDWFAAKALIALAADCHFGTTEAPCDPWPWVAEQAFKAAAAMIEARGGKK